MISMEHSELDKALKLLNGLDNDSHKRIEIIKYVQQSGKIAVFAYGSLLWKPFEYVDEMIFDCTLDGYKKGFICEDFIYRGTMNFTGLTMGLQEDSDGYVNGALLISSTDGVIPFIKAFVERETPTSVNGIVMDIYTYDFVKIVMPDGVSTHYALTCIVNPNSLFYLNPQLTLEEQAQKIALAYGQNGTNFQYLQRVIDAYHKFNIEDSCTCEIEGLHDKVLLYRQSLSISDQKWLEVYDEPKTLEGRQKEAKPDVLMGFQASIEPHLHRSLGIERICQQFY
jgi:cation transport regulator ChaC